MLAFDGSVSCEIAIRVQRAKADFRLMGNFWYRQVEFRFRVIVFKALVVSAALSALVSFVVSVAQLEVLESCVAKQSSKLLRGSACRKLIGIDQTVKYGEFERRDILGFVGWAPLHIGLDV